MRGTRARPRPASASGRVCTERGLTLIELLISVTILGLLILPLGATIALSLRSTAATQTRFTGSRGAQTTAAFFANDVQSATTVTPGDLSPCGGGANSPALVSLRWSDDLDVSNVVSYAARTVGADRQLVRVACVAGTGAVTTVVAHGLDPGNPTVSCTPSCSAPRSVSLRVATADGFTFDLNGTRRSA